MCYVLGIENSLNTDFDKIIGLDNIKNLIVSNTKVNFSVTQSEFNVVDAEMDGHELKKRHLLTDISVIQMGCTNLHKNIFCYVIRQERERVCWVYESGQHLNKLYQLIFKANPSLLQKENEDEGEGDQNPYSYFVDKHPNNGPPIERPSVLNIDKEKPSYLFTSEKTDKSAHKLLHYPELVIKKEEQQNTLSLIPHTNKRTNAHFKINVESPVTNKYHQIEINNQIKPSNKSTDNCLQPQDQLDPNQTKLNTQPTLLLSNNRSTQINMYGQGDFNVNTLQQQSFKQVDFRQPSIKHVSTDFNRSRLNFDSFMAPSSFTYFHSPGTPCFPKNSPCFINEKVGLENVCCDKKWDHNLKVQEWYHGRISLVTAMKRVRNNGDFLVRKDKHKYILHVKNLFIMREVFFQCDEKGMLKENPLNADSIIDFVGKAIKFSKDIHYNGEVFTLANPVCKPQ
uniref:SH2 domain-containing protein n=1 Tax=Rhabditophanes sp. KR3021 TaxID=114890 RepID=A0AC35TZW3_9BILA